MAEVGFAVCGAADVVPGEVYAAAGTFFADGLEEVHGWFDWGIDGVVGGEGEGGGGGG